MQAQLIRLNWLEAEDSLQKLCHPKKGFPSPLTNLIDQVFMTLACIPWNDNILGFPGSVPTHSLAKYATTGWLTDEHETQMLELLKQDLARSGRASGIEVQPIHFIPLLSDAYKDGDNAYLTKQHYTWLRHLGHACETGLVTKIPMIANTGNNQHWVAIIIDFADKVVWYGDSMDAVSPPKHLRNVLDWWIQKSLPTMNTMFPYQKMPITEQEDTYSCGLLAWNALSSFLLEDVKIFSPNSIAEERLKVLLSVAERHHAKVRAISQWQGKITSKRLTICSRPSRK